MIEYLFIRHGQTDWNLGQRVMGRQTIPLNETGVKQATAAAKYLDGVSLCALATSPVRRAVETAEIILKARPGLDMVFEEGLTEIDYGQWVNQTIPDIVAKNPDLWRSYREKPDAFKAPGGESLLEARDRAVKSVLNLRQKYPEGRIAMISHADTIKLAVTGLLKWPMATFREFSIDNCAMFLLREHPELGMRIVVFNPMTGVGRDVKDGQ